MEIVRNKKTRSDLAKYFNECGFTTGAEIGVERGVYSKMILTRNPQLTQFYAIDLWKPYKGYREHVSAKKLDDFLSEATNRLSPFPCTIIREDSVEAVSHFKDESLDFVYIDANHSYENVLSDIKAWYPKVKTGGIISGHDYVRRKGQDHIFGVVMAVNDFCKELGIEKLFIWDGERSPSWSFSK